MPFKMSLGGTASSSTATPSSSSTKPIGFKLTNTPSAKAKAKATTKTAFGGHDDDDDNNVQKAKSSTSQRLKPGAKPVVVAQTSDKLTKRQQQLQQQQLELDATVYEYDTVYDSMKQGERLALDERKKEAGERKPKYISGLLETAEQRKRDRLRAEDKMVQREREREGDEFADKDQFVTPAYLAQQEELKKIEEEEKKKEEHEAKNAKGMSAFFKTYLDSNDKAHEQAVAASLAAQKSSSTHDNETSFTIEPPPSLKEKSEVEIAKEFEQKTGKHVEVNDDGQIVDKRQLLSGGLNVVAKPKSSTTDSNTSATGFGQRISDRTATANNSHADAVGSLLAPGLSKAERAKQARERHSREVERQMMALEQKRKREAEEQLQNKVEKLAKRNDETKVESVSVSRLAKNHVIHLL
ncbi:hypothetical protein OIO90_001773 [Microbotryomycetes sp. JL221]|nr:hypothetical protein OIO90_001773 [Microbotryomycetes sp. JL221]